MAVLGPSRAHTAAAVTVPLQNCPVSLWLSLFLCEFNLWLSLVSVTPSAGEGAVGGAQRAEPVWDPQPRQVCLT